MPLAPHLDQAYRRARYQVAAQSLRIGRRAPALDALLAALATHEAVLITAWNPRSRRMPPLWNARRQAALLERIRGVPPLSGYSAGRGWEEEMVLLAMPLRRAQRLGRLFRQAALVVIRRGQKPRLHSLL